MIRKPNISIVASAHRPQNWMKLYESIGDNDHEFEIVFVGPNKPDYPLPYNFRFIQSFVKPVQCLEIAYRNCTADLVMNIADDCFFRTPKPLDRLYELYKSYDNEKLILSCRYMLNGEDLSEDCHYFFLEDKSSPIMPLAGLMSKKLFTDIGGIDKNFIAVAWDLDIAMRVYALGGEVKLSDVSLDEKKTGDQLSSIYGEFGWHDRGLLLNLWLVNGKVQLNRAKPVEPFSDLKILEESQGPRGRWRGSSPVVLEKLADFINFYFGDFYRQSLSVLGMGYCAIQNPGKYPEYAKKICRRLLSRKVPPKGE